jgi:two-component system, chemotaxis family, CheB/CheR fusion protein
LWRENIAEAKQMASERAANQSASVSLATELDVPLPHSPLSIVGIGASAGGLEAFSQLLRHLSIHPERRGTNEPEMAYVLIQHLDPNHPSLLTEILARTTKMPVTEVTDGIEVEPNHVYIIPPNKQMIFAAGRLQISPRTKTKGIYHPIDLFFRSIAAACGNRAIGIVLSGSDGDGALGLSAIKAAGGTTFAQDIGSARFDGMPQHAADTGHVDFILPPVAIASQLERIGGGLPVDLGAEVVAVVGVASPGENLPSEPPADSRQQIFEFLHLQTGVNFASYKQATIDRRMQRRLRHHRIFKLEEYLSYLQANPPEVEALYADLLIDVTSFFRDPEVFQALQADILPQIVNQKSPKSAIRIWVAGCATGEEIYSVAICLLEVMAEAQISTQVQIFATDLNEASIEMARRGIYPLQRVKHITPERLAKFFVRVEGGYQINRSVRDLCVFARHNLGSDPPFSRLDLIVCRNVLIYFSAKLQKAALQSLHYGLKPNGFLMLGTSETPGGSTELFNPVDKKHQIYSKRSIEPKPSLDFVIDGDVKPRTRQNAMPIEPLSGQTVVDRSQQTAKIDLQKVADELLWKHYAPAGVVINADLEIIQFRGETGAYLSAASGRPSFSLLKMVSVNLRVELRSAINQAKKFNLPVTKSEPIERVKFTVIPFQVPGFADRYLLILFESLAESLGTKLDRPERAMPASHQSTNKQIRKTLVEQENIRLRQKLALTQEHLQSTLIEQEEIASDAQAAKEEMLSSNEEFQSTNEELETAKEEIQATNEELSTVNEELRGRNLEVTLLNNDLINILSSVQLPILIVGADLKIGRFTPMAAQLFNLIPADIGRSFSHIRHNLDLADLDRAILHTIETLVVYQCEVRDTTGGWYHLIVRPYKTGDDRIAGATIVLLDVSELKHQTQEMQASRDYAKAIVATIIEPLIVLDRNFQIVTANPAFYQMFEVTDTQIEGQLLQNLGNNQWRIPGLRSRLENVFRTNTPFQDYEVEHTFEQIGRKTMVLNALQIYNAGGEPLLLLTIVDITHRKQLEAERGELLDEAQSARAKAESANLAKDTFLSILSHELRSPLSAILGWSRLIAGGKVTPAQIKHGIEVIDRSATTQNQLIGDLLDVSSITNGKLRLDIHPIDLVPIITDAIETVSLAAKAKNIQIQTQLDPAAHRILGDSTRIQQVLWNLLGNAIKFTDPGGKITVHLSVVNVQRSATVQIQIIDSGKGIEPDFLPYIFDRFLQADSTSTRSYVGLGLGLTIVRYLVELHGGTISVVSRVGSGSTFTVHLPLSTQLPAEPAFLGAIPSGLAASSPPIADGSTLVGIHVLLVDDEADMRQLLTAILDRAGATVTATESVALALETLQANPDRYHVLLSDIGLPEQDGWMLIRQVRQLSPESGGRIPAAALTAYASDRDREMAIRLGFQVHIAKPIEPNRLVAIVADLARD